MRRHRHVVLVARHRAHNDGGMWTAPVGGTTRSRTLVGGVLAISLVGLVGCSSSDHSSGPSSPSSVAVAPPASPSQPSTASPSQAPPTLSSTVYDSPDGYTIRPPEAWVLHPTGGENGLSVLFSAPSADPAVQRPFADSLTVAIASTTDSLDVLMTKTKQQYPNYLKNYTVITDQPITLSDGRSQGHLLGGTYDMPGTGLLQNIQLTVLNAGKSYTVTFTSPASDFDNYHTLVQAVLASFAFR